MLRQYEINMYLCRDRASRTMGKANTDYTDERAEDLMRVYHDCLSRKSVIHIDEVYEEVAGMPARRFYVSVPRAIRVVRRMDGGDTALRDMSAGKRDMFSEIYNRVCRIRGQKPHAPLRRIVAHVVYGRAPRFYISARSVKAIILGKKSRTPKRCAGLKGNGYLQT